LLGYELNLDVLRERVFPFVLALQAFLGSLQLLDALRVGYYPMILRVTNFVCVSKVTLRDEIVMIFRLVSFLLSN